MGANMVPSLFVAKIEWNKGLTLEKSSFIDLNYVVISL